MSRKVMPASDVAPHAPPPRSTAEQLLDAQARAIDGALLTIAAGDGRVSFDERFASMWSLDAAAFQGSTTDALVEALRHSDEAGAMAAELLVTSDTAPSGEMASPDGRVIGWHMAETRHALSRVWIFRELSAERIAQRALRDAENWLRMFSAHTDGLVLELDVDAHIVGVWAPDTTLFSSGALNGQSLGEALGEAEGAPFEARVKRVLETGVPASFDIVRGDGPTERVFAVNAVLVPAVEGLPSSCTVLVRDVTERAQLQKQLLQAEKLASLGVLAAGIAHEINNPLAYMLLNLERLRGAVSMGLLGDAKNDELAMAVQLTIEGAERIQQIVLGLRRFARSERDDPLGPVDVQRVLNFTAEMVAVELRDRARLTLDLGDVPLVLASEGRLTQVFLNLLLNAAQSIGAGDPEHNEIRIVTRTDEHGRAVVDVHDTGAGISSAALPHIFDPFFTTRAPGTGLGLAICHGLVTSLGGEISVETRLGAGSVFRVILPSADAVRDPAR